MVVICARFNYFPDECKLPHIFVAAACWAGHCTVDQDTLRHYIKYEGVEKDPDQDMLPWNAEKRRVKNQS